MKRSQRTAGGIVAISTMVGASLLAPGIARAESEVLVPGPVPVIDCGHPYGDDAEAAECPVQIDGSIRVVNRTRQDRVKSVRIIIRNPNGKRVARVDINVEVAARSRVLLDPAQYLDIASATDGRYTYVVRNLDENGKLTRWRNSRGSFDVAVAMA